MDQTAARITVSKKLSSRDYKRVLTEITEYAYNYLIHIHKDIQNAKKIENKSEQDLGNLDALVHTFDLVNDIIHPAHNISRSILKIHPTFIDYIQEMHIKQVKEHNPEPCWCSSCKESVGNLSVKTKETSNGKEGH